MRGYDNWKLMTPEEEYESRHGDKVCPWCGAYDVHHCEMQEEMGTCPWEDGEPGPDALMEAKRDDREWDRNFGRDD